MAGISLEPALVSRQDHGDLGGAKKNKNWEKHTY
jgi:hypothetical protein